MSAAREAMNRADSYCRSRQIVLVRNPALGSGKDGSVWQTSAGTAVQAFGIKRNSDDELDCDRRFDARGITTVNNLAVSLPEGWNGELHVIGMTIVEPPCLPDFGKVCLDRPPPYGNGEEVMAGTVYK